MSWLNSQFKAVAVHRGTVEGTYEHPVDIEGPANFEALVREAVRQTGYHGQTVSLVLAHPRLTQQLVEVPPVKGAAIRKVVQRQARQQKLFPGEASWTYQRSVPAKGGQQVILHLFPKGLLDQLVQGCHRNGLHLVSVVPPSALLHRQLLRFGLDKADLGLLAAETGGSTTVAIARGDAQLVLARAVSGSWNESAERLALDLNRTLPFVAQQFGNGVKAVWLFGPGAAQHREAMQRTMKLPLQISPIEHTPLYWATESLKLDHTQTPNFISPVQQQAPQRRTFAKITAFATALVLVGSLVVAAYCHARAKQEAASNQTLRKNSARLEIDLRQATGRSAELAREQQLVRLIVDSQPPPVPLWFTGYLEEAVPRELVVTNLHVREQEDFWQFEMDGTSQSAGIALSPEIFSRSVSLLRSNLVNGRFHVELAGPKPPGPGAVNHFAFEGTMRLTKL